MGVRDQADEAWRLGLDAVFIPGNWRTVGLALVLFRGFSPKFRQVALR